MHAEMEVREDLCSLWRKLAQDPDSPDRFELTEQGEIVLSPLPTNRHQLIISFLARQLEDQLGGHGIQDLAVLTGSAGVRCPDIAWLPSDRLPEVLNVGPLENAPPLIVEVLSPGNRKQEMAHKIRGYLDGGVQEVAVVALDGTVAFYREDGPHPESALGVRLALPAHLFA